MRLSVSSRCLSPSPRGWRSLPPVPCIAVSVADSWTGEAISELLKRLIAQMGRPAAYLKDGGREWQKAADLREPHGLASPCLDDISHAAANRLKRYSQHHPTLALLVGLRACLDELPACKARLKRFQGDAQGVLACQKSLKTQGLSHDTLTQCQPLIGKMPSAPVRQELEAYLEYELATAKT